MFPGAMAKCGLDPGVADDEIVDLLIEGVVSKETDMPEVLGAK
jgi:hypothetical protein